MYKNQFIAITFVSLMLFAGIATFGQIRVLEIDSQQDSEIEIHANILNRGDAKVNDVKLTFYVPELGIFLTEGKFDISSGRSIGRWMFLDIENSDEPQEYVIRLKIYNEGMPRTKYRHIII